jgi:signal transduction histidine kinase/CheY-like chemotaxis protein
MPSFRDSPIRRKLMLLSVLTNTVTLLFACAAFVGYERVTYREATLQRISSQAEIVGYNIASALLFDDPESAGKTLAALRAEPNVLAAAVYRKSGTRFAMWDRSGTSGAELPPALDGPTRGHSFERSRLRVTRPIVVDQDTIGSVSILTDLSEVNARLMSYLGIALLVFLAAIACAFGISWIIQRVVSQPILHLVDTARVVSNEQNYAIRARPGGRDEIGLLIQTFNEMLAQIQTRDSEVERALAEAETGNRAKDEFLAVVSHELRTPLTPIISWTRLLATGDLDPSTTRRALESIERNARSQAQLVDDLLDVSRIIAGKVRLDIQQLELAPLLEAAIDSTRPAADAKGIRIQTVLDPRAGHVAADPERLQQVFWNLLSNAIKFTPQDGRVAVQLRRVDSHVEVVVSDTGQGINPEFLPHVFERFRQADSTSKRVHGGLGLGLAIVRHIVELHGGRVHATSPGEGQGASFRVELPVSWLRPTATSSGIHATANTAPSPLAPSTAIPGLRVLVVDDEPDTLETVQTILGKCGAEVRTAASANDALAALDDWLPDVVISDIGMPDQDGYELIRHVRERPAARGGLVPAIALTAYARIEDRLKALAAGFQMHVPKPVDPAELVAVVASLAGWAGKGARSR